MISTLRDEHCKLIEHFTFLMEAFHFKCIWIRCSHKPYMWKITITYETTYTTQEDRQKKKLSWWKNKSSNVWVRSHSLLAFTHYMVMVCFTTSYLVRFYLLFILTKITLNYMTHFGWKQIHEFSKVLKFIWKINESYQAI